MFNALDPNLPLVWSFQNDDVRKLFRENVLGGLSTVSHRHINLNNDPEKKYPKSTQFAANDEKFTCVTFLDFNSMYLWAQQQDLPLSPGINWTLYKGRFTKSVMRPGVSLGQLQWLYTLQESGLCVDSKNNKVRIEHEYHRGEHSEAGFKFDGFFIKDGIKHYLEFNGCRYHPGCCVSDADIKGAATLRERWNRKKKYCESQGKMIVINECKWEPIECDTEMGRINYVTETPDKLLEGILSGELFGFAVCDVTSDQDFQTDYLSGHLFPPIFRKEKLSKEFLSPLMRQRYETKNKRLDTSVIQTFNGRQLLLMTPLIQFYASIGMKISNLTRFIQYVPGKALLPFTEKVVKLRCEATKENDNAKQLTAKLFGNAGKKNFLILISIISRLRKMR